MKIICVEPGETLALYLKPETAIARADWPVFVPDWSQEVTFSAQLVVRLNRLGKSIPERFAHRYYDEVTVGVGFTTADLKRDLLAHHLPADIATGFDGSAYCGQQWLRLSELSGEGEAPLNVQQLTVETAFNEEPVVRHTTAEMLHTVDQIIALASRYYLLKTGDLIFTGMPLLEGTVHEGDVITGRLQGRDVMCCRCK